MPSETATVSGSSALIATTASQTRSSSFVDGPRTATTMQNSPAPRACASRAASTKPSTLESDVGLDVGCVTRALRAEVAVLRAAAALRVVQHFDGDSIAAVQRAHVVGKRQQLGQFAFGKRGKLHEQIAAGGQMPYQYAGTREVDRRMRHGLFWMHQWVEE